MNYNAIANSTITSTSLRTVTPSTVVDTGPFDRVSVITAIATEGLLATAIAANTIAMATTEFHYCPTVNGRYDRRPTTAANTNTRIVAVCTNVIDRRER